MSSDFIMGQSPAVRVPLTQQDYVIGGAWSNVEVDNVSAGGTAQQAIAVLRAAVR